MEMVKIAEIRRVLGGRRAKELAGGGRTHAAVALILRETPSGLEVLFIRRAEHGEDPWSGDLAFPGGKVDSGDPSARGTAERETAEEVGLDLSAAEFLGCLDDIEGAYLPVRVSCFVYAVTDPPPLVLNEEVGGAHWVPLQRLLDGEFHGEALFSWLGEERTHPVVDLLGPGHPHLWGITYRLVIQFLNLLGHRP